MIQTRTPLRISLFGGGTDMPEFFTRHIGAVVSFCINKYIYISVNEKFDGRTRVSYSKTEIVDDPKKLEHDLVREALKYSGLSGLEITSVSDIPGEGSGLGSSSAFLVGLLVALTGHVNGSVEAHPSVFAQTAHLIERFECGYPVGKQDHYAAAHGGLHYYQFNQDGTVFAELIKYSKEVKRFLENEVMLFYLGRTRKANTILGEQARRFVGEETTEAGISLRDAAMATRMALEDGRTNDIGWMMHEAWKRKKKLSTVSDAEIDDIYERAVKAGALGGKVCGAGGGGFMIFVAKPECQRGIEEAIGLRRVRFEIADQGSQVVYRG